MLNYNHLLVMFQYESGTSLYSSCYSHETEIMMKLRTRSVRAATESNVETGNLRGARKMHAIRKGRAMRKRQQTDAMHFRRMSFNWFARQLFDKRTDSY